MCWHCLGICPLSIGLCLCRGMSNGEWITYISSGPSDSALNHLMRCHTGSLHCHSLHFINGRAKSTNLWDCHASNCSHTKCSLTHPYMDQIGQQSSQELNSFSQHFLQEKSVGHSQWRARLMSKSLPPGNDIPYVLNWQSSDVPRNECDENFILFRVIRGSGTTWSWVGIVLC